MTEKMIAHGGITLASEVLGAADKGTILLAMGATASMVWWPDALIEGLVVGGYQVIRFDHRDTGRSTNQPLGTVDYDIHDLASDLLAVLDAHDVAAAHVVGMSLGAYVAQIDALKHPDRVLSLTMISAEPLGAEYEGEGIPDEFMDHMGGMATLDWSDRDAVAGFMLEIARLSAGHGRPFDADAAMARVKREISRTASMASAFNHSMVGGELEPGLSIAGLTQPLLIIHGSDDPIIAVAAARKTASLVPEAELLVLDGVGHELPADAIPEIVAAILDNCARSPA